MTVERLAGGAEDGAAVKDRQDLLLRPRYGPVPKLEMASVFLFPILVQVNEDIDPPVQAKLLVVAEVGMDLQQTARPDLVQTASSVIRIRQHTPNPRQGLQKLEHRAAVHEPKHIPNWAGQLLHNIEGQLLALIYVAVGMPFRIPWLGKRLKRGLSHLNRQE